MQLFKQIIMRCSLFITICCIAISIVTAGDVKSQEKRVLAINLAMTDATVVSIIESISQQTGYKFFYDGALLSQMKHISVHIKDATLQQALEQVTEQTQLGFYKSEDTYIVIPPKEQAPPASKQQPGIRVTGTVSDNYGERIPGVSVILRGSASTGTITDANGEFSLTVPSDTSVLQFSYIGYQMQEIKVGNLKIITVTMQEDVTELGEVTVVAFGQQKKESVIGSITTVNVSDLKRPTSNLTAALAGNIAGVIAYQRSGEPGQDNADFFVRGITTFGTNTNPLILIDNIELTSTDLARLRPDDIESFSVMKDATATALYGARGANGVILVTTKQGKTGPVKVSFRLENSLSMPTQNIEIADPVTFMKLSNEAIQTRLAFDPSFASLLTNEYSQEQIEMTEAGRYPLIFPANDWRKMLFKDYTMNQRANINFSGGGTVARYYVSGSFNRDNGIMNVDQRNNFNNNIAINNYDLRTNVNIDLTKTTELSVRLSANFEDYRGPIPGGSDLYRAVLRTNPVLFPAYFPKDEDHQYVEHIMFGYNPNVGNPYATMVSGYKERSRSQVLAQVEMKQDLKFITEGLSIRGMLNVSRLSQFAVNRAYTPFYYAITNRNLQTGDYTLSEMTTGTEYLGYAELPSDRVQNSTFYLEGTANYTRDFGKHGVSALLVYVMRHHLNANAGTLQLSLPSRNLGLSGRTTYSYDSRYFAEFNFGYNGSERFDKKHRFGFFPSAGVAWSISNEQFWESIKPIVSNLRLRYSYGLVGNDQIGDTSDRFFYLSEVNMNAANRTATWGQEIYALSGIYTNRYANPNVTWEVSTKQNFALELGLWKKLTMIAEYFTEYRRNILMTRSAIPRTMGLTAPQRANVGEASGRGVDISLEYQQNWTTDFWTSARANLTYATSRYEVYEEPQYDEPWRSLVGQSLRQGVGYIAERLFVDDAEAANAPPQTVSSSNMPYGGGDIKYMDVNRDGIVNEADRVPIGNPTVAEIVYGFGFSMGYKGFDFSAFFQGATNQSFWINAASTSPFAGDTQMLKVYADSYWSEANRDIFATWPRLSPTIHTNNVAQNTWFMRDGTFLRLKQAEFGYTLPSRWTEKMKMTGLRFYVSGTNLLLFSKFKLWDVEMAGEGLGYPIQRVFNIGLNLSFN